MIRISLNVKSQGTIKIEVFSQGTDDSKHLKCGTLYIADCEYKNITSFAVLDIKLWLEEDSDFNIQITHICRIKGCGGAGWPPPTNNFRKT